VSADLPACMGCFVNQGWFNSIPVPQLPTEFYKLKPQPTPDVVTSSEEQEILLHLVAAWNKFKDLANLAEHDLREFNYAIHLAQQKIALRVARRVDPLIWSQPNDEA
jgi:hypothetical protein